MEGALTIEPHAPMVAIERLDEALFSSPNNQDEIKANFPLPSDPKWACLKARMTRISCKEEPFCESQAELEEKFRALHYALESNHVAPKDLILNQVIPFISSMATQVDDLFADGAPPLLLQGEAKTVELSQAQCCCLLSLAFFDALPGPPDHREMPGEFSFSYWLSNQPEKTKCLLHYFLRSMRRAEAATTENDARGWGQRTVAFTRKVLADPAAVVSLAALQASEVPLGDFAVEGDAARIEDAQGLLQADFANEYLGGGALHAGSVQEEILFAVTPECLVGMLLCERMALNEAVEIVGAERFCAHTGYGRGPHGFRFAGAHEDATPAAAGVGGRLAARIVALDAEVVCHAARAQYGAGSVLREMTKLAAALAPGPEEEAAAGLAAFATGNWGCGAFGGDPQLKSLLQWAAASQAGRGVRYFPFADRRAAGLGELAGRLARARWTVGRLVTALLRYAEEGLAVEEPLFQYLAWVVAGEEEEGEAGDG